MKKIIYTALFSILSYIGIAQTVTELVVPQFMASKTASTINNARMYFPICLRIDGLMPDSTYAIRVSMGLTTDAATSFGAGNIWGTSSFGSVNPTFKANSVGSTGPIWFYLQPTGNGTRFGAGSIHNLRVGWAIAPTVVPSTPSYVSTRTITSLDIAATALTVATSDDGAFLQGNSLSVASGRIVLSYDNVAGTGNPLSSSRILNHSLVQQSQSELPAAIDSILKPGTNAIAGDYALVIPIGANNPNGIRRIEIRDTLNNLIASSIDADGIWPSTGNTTTVLRRGIVNINNTDAPLPVSWKSINVLGNDNGNVIKWSTASETNNSHFEVQRSGDGANYKTIATVKGKGTTANVSYYNYNDIEGTQTDATYYRLKQVDFDGKSSYSKVVAVLNNEQEVATGITTTLPNPFNDELVINVQSGNNTSASIQVIDMIGKTHKVHTQQFVKGVNKVEINTEDMPNGIYFVRVSANGETFTKKVIKK